MSHFRCKEYASLKSFNTLGVEASARYLCPAFSEGDIAAISRFAHEKNLPLIPVGEGSNIVFGEHIEAVVMPVLLKHYSVSYEVDSNHALVTAGAGYHWHTLVRLTLDQGLFGLENLSLIPGNVGAAPVQNIGAYGVEIKDVLVQVRGYHCSKQRYVTLNHTECALRYRDSIFKQALCNDFIITEVTLRLSRALSPHLSYSHLLETIQARSSGSITGMAISDAVCHIRQCKLPDPHVLGNAGSFFKNPIVSSECMQRIRVRYPGAVAYSLENGQWKLAAGWLIEACGLKGYRSGNVGTYKKQALVIVNHGGATGHEVLAFANFIQQKVVERFEVHLEIEPTIYCSGVRRENS